MGIFETIGQGFRAVAEVCGLISKRSDLNNAPDMKDRKIAAEDVKTENQIESAVQKEDEKATRNTLG